MILLVLFHIVFFCELYTKPFTMATGELLSTFFPSWRHNEKTDPYYWYNIPGHPVLSTYYPIHRLSSMFGNLFGLDTSFKILLYTILSHYLFASIGWFLLLQHYFTTSIALFGAITFTYQAYHIKQQPCIVYTLSWFPWALLCPWLGVGMMLLAGYYPLAMYLLPTVPLITHNWQGVAIGFLIGSIQVIPFLKYLPKTVRSHSREDVTPNFWETNFYTGITPIILLILHPQWRYLWIGIIIISSYLLRSFLPRVYQRAWLLSAYVVVLESLKSLVIVSSIDANVVELLLLLQCLDFFIHNSSLLPTRPYCELYRKPSLAFKSNQLVKYLESHLGKDERVAGLPWPLFTGLINKWRTVGYHGGMRLNLMEKHGFPRRRVRFAFSRKKLDWFATPVRYLYENPEYLLLGRL